MYLSATLWLLLRVVQVASKYWPPRVDMTKANENWQSEGCVAFGNEREIFAAVRLALKTEHREVYLSLSSGWMDRFLLPLQHVKVTCLSVDELAWTRLESGFQATDEVLHVVFAVGSGTSQSLDVLPSVDRFLLHNPCWVVLKDAAYHSQSPHNITTNGGVVTESKQRHHSSRAAQSLIAVLGVLTSVYSFTSIFLRMPVDSLGPTCRLYASITARQFPPECPSSNDLFFYAMQNFGFGGEANKVIKTFAYNLASDAERVYARPLGEKLKWSWADATGVHCSTQVFLADPWACSFLPLSNCSFSPPAGRSREEDVDLTQYISPNWGDYGPTKDTNHKFLARLGIDGGMLTKHRDGTAFSKEPATWASLRLYPFLMRPNLRTRHFIRLGLDRRIVRLLPLKLSAMTNPSTPIPHILPVSLFRRDSVAIDDQDGTRARRTGEGSFDGIPGQVWFPGLGGCLGMHVRNADVLTDWRRGRAVDRSLNAHVFMSFNLSSALSLPDVFLASDNASLLYIAPTEYPQYRWFSQLRPIRPFEEQMRRGALHHVHENDPQREIANILVDALLIGRCEALVGQGDGSVTHMYHMYQCNLANSLAACPPMVDLQWISEEGVMPYVGRRSGPLTYAAFG